MSKLFICHSSTDKPFVRRLADDLTHHKLSVWVDEREILVGDPIRKKIEEGLEASDYLGLVLSPASVQSEWVQKELDAKLIEEIESKRVVVLPILLSNCQIPALLRGKLYADFRSDYGTGLQTLLARFRHNDRELEVKRRVLQKLSGEEAARVDTHLLMHLALSARQLDAAEELVSVHDVTHPKCPVAPQVKLLIDIVKHSIVGTAASWVRAANAAVKLIEINPVDGHFQNLQNLCANVPDDRECVQGGLQLLGHAMDRIEKGDSSTSPRIAALVIQAIHRLPLETQEVNKVVRSSHQIIRDFDRLTLRSVLSPILHASTHLIKRTTNGELGLLRQVYHAARVKVDTSQEYSDAFLHLAWAAAQLGITREALHWLEAYQLTVPASVFDERVAKHPPLDHIVGHERTKATGATKKIKTRSKKTRR